LVVTRQKSLAFRAAPGFGGELKFSHGFGGHIWWWRAQNIENGGD
jgi:hypothetical protein